MARPQPKSTRRITPLIGLATRLIEHPVKASDVTQLFTLRDAADRRNVNAQLLYRASTFAVATINASVVAANCTLSACVGASTTRRNSARSMMSPPPPRITPRTQPPPASISCPPARSFFTESADSSK